ncbi:hypothetical protein C0Q70_10791 [Pomacea canaliculata]|uniref:Uncharacterized protein n=1 Tax=Pomacea canaliculata TaxID=400727 RepID=A0A2T7P455_POMCA|nr:hypothetical protein C0Q70_10791 [Pomacea canaliculata]
MTDLATGHTLQACPRFQDLQPSDTRKKEVRGEGRERGVQGPWSVADCRQVADDNSVVHAAATTTTTKEERLTTPVLAEGTSRRMSECCAANYSQLPVPNICCSSRRATDSSTMTPDAKCRRTRRRCQLAVNRIICWGGLGKGNGDGGKVSRQSAGKTATTAASPRGGGVGRVCGQLLGMLDVPGFLSWGLSHSHLPTDLCVCVWLVCACVKIV